MTRISTLLILLFIFAVPSPLFAQEINDEGADRIKGIFEEFLQNQKEKASGKNATLSTNGDVTVEQATDYYAVTLPNLTIIDKKENKTQIGMIAINVKPTEEKENWTMSVALPMPIVQKNKEGTVIGELNIGQQKMSGIWNEAIKNFIKVDAQYDNLVLNNVKKNKTASLNNIIIESDISLKDDKMSGPTDVTINGFKATDKNGEDSITIDQIMFNASYDDIHYEMLHSQNFIPLAKNLGGMRLKGTLKNLKGAYNLDLVNFDYNAPKPSDNKADQFLRFSYNGLEAKKENMIYADLIPQKSDINLELKNLPMDSILSVLKTHMEKSDKQTAAEQLVMMQMITNLPKNLAKAGTLFNIQNFDFKNTTYDFQTKGELKATKDSALGVIGNMTLRMNGLDETQSLVDTKMEDASEKDKAILQRIKGQLTSLKNIMKPHNDGYKSEIVLTEEGNVTINGEDAGNPINAVGTLQQSSQ